MKKGVEIYTYFISINGVENIETLHQKNIFFDWESAEEYLKDRIQILNKNEIFRIEFNGNKFGEMNKKNFSSLQKIKDYFSQILLENNAEKEKINNTKSERIFVRYFPKEKEELRKKAEKENLTISEYIRQSSLHSKRVEISIEEKRILNNASININQFVKAIHEQRKVGESISNNTIERMIKEWETLSFTFRQLIEKYESRKPKNDSKNN